MKYFFYVFIGSGLGGTLRYALSLVMKKYNFTLPIHTLSANVIACILLGITMGYLINHSENNNLKYLVVIGICGGLSTYSSFSYEVFQQLESGAWTQFIIYSFCTFIVCLLCIMIGLWIGKNLF
jgi:CrcB protein